MLIDPTLPCVWTRSGHFRNSHGRVLVPPSMISRECQKNWFDAEKRRKQQHHGFDASEEGSHQPLKSKLGLLLLPFLRTGWPTT
jgi:hypothetical protein